LGELPEDEVKPVFQEALAFVYPSAYEGFGLPPLEAMACGVPVICSTLTSLPEVVGDAALPIRDFAPEEIANLLAEVEQKETLRHRLAEAGRARAAQFTWKRTAERTAEVYLEAIDRPPAATLLHRQMVAHLLETLGPK
jgi:glycosyltransferase involved in cell wall biosynthesis